MTQRKLFQRPLAAALFLAVSGLLLTGCGGGGGGSNPGGPGGPGSTPPDVLGKVVDMNGAGVPGASVSVQGGSTVRTLTGGAYRILNAPQGLVTLSASGTFNGTQYTGSTQAFLAANNVFSNVNIVLSPPSQQATLTGTVRDAAGRPLASARVLLAVLVSSNPLPGTTAGDAASLVAFTDGNGNYRMPSIPAQNIQYTAAASLLHYQNGAATVSNLQPGETRGQDFTLAGSFNQGAVTPTNVAAYSLTQSSSDPQPSVAGRVHLSRATSSVPSVSEEIRRLVSPAWARHIAGRHTALQVRRLRTRPHLSGFGSTAIEMGVVFDNVNQPPSLAGFRIYSSTGSNPVTPYDFLQDPLANVYTDLDPFYVPDQQFNFAVSAFNTDDSETGVSPTVSVVPLEQVSLAQPLANQTLANPITLAWNSVPQAASYYVFLYSQFPGPGVLPIFPNAQENPNPLPAGTTSYTLQGSLASGSTYWAVVAAVDGTGAAVSVSPITLFHVQ